MQLPPLPLPFSVVRAALQQRRRLAELADAALPAEAALYDFAAGLQRTKLAGVLVTSGLADELAGTPRQPLELARLLELQPDVTQRVLHAAAASRLVELDRSGAVSLSRIGAPLAAAHPSSIASWIAYQAAPATARAYDELGAQLRNGAEPSGHRLAFGSSAWERFAEHADEGARFNAAMRELTAIDVSALARAYPWPRRGVICDVAGGIGTLLVEILKRRRSSRGILIDTPAVLAEAQSFLRQRGISERVECREGDLFGLLTARADVYILKWILHDWSDEACREILARVAATMPKGSRLVVIDQHREPDRPNPVTAMIDLHMLAQCEGGRERSPEEVQGLMRAVGLLVGRVRHAGLTMLVEASAQA